MSPSATVSAEPVDASLVSYTHIIYALHSLAVLIGLTSTVTIIGSFIFGLPSIIAVIMNYAGSRMPAGHFWSRISAGRSGPFGLRCCGRL